MDRFLTGKTALVTGGTRGIGRAVVEHLARTGARVMLNGRTEESVDKALAELRSPFGDQVTGVAADVSQPEAIARLFEEVRRRLGGLDILVNNAGIGVFRAVKDLTIEEWRQVIDINLSGAFYCSREAIPLMIAKGGGFIINVSSLAGKNPFAGGAAYNASKFGLNGFSEAMMLDHRYDGIRVASIMPGSVDTDFSPRSGRAGWKIAPEDIAEIVIFLLRMPPRTLISRVEVRPSQPQK